jgi:hypothetical protein
MYLVSTRVWACGCADTRAGARAWAASASGCSRRSERIGVSITCMRVCVRACTSVRWLCGGRGWHARVVRGRSIHFTKLRALPEWLGRCKLLENLCVPRPPPRAASRACRAGRWAAPRGVGCGGGGVASRRPRPSPARACLAPAADRRALGVGPSRSGRPHGWARRTAGGPELAALPAAADWPSLKRLCVPTRPRQCADAWAGGS